MLKLTILQGNRLSVLKSSEMLLQIAEAVDFLHKLGYIHSNISSHSIMMLSTSIVKLANLEQMAKQGARVQGPRPSSPWACNACPLPRVHCDVFSLGCVLYGVCSGQCANILQHAFILGDANYKRWYYNRQGFDEEEIDASALVSNLIFIIQRFLIRSFHDWPSWLFIILQPNHL